MPYVRMYSLTLTVLQMNGGTFCRYVNYGMYGTFYGHQLLPKPLWEDYLAAGCRSKPGLDPGPVCTAITAKMDQLTSHLDP